MHHMNLRAVQQSLGSRGVNCARDGSNPDGSQRFAVWRRGQPRITARTAACVDMAYILGLKLAPRHA